METILANLLSPIMLAFVLGIVATLVRSDLRFPEPLYQGISMYLLLAIGMKGGVALVASPWQDVLFPLLGAFLLSAAIPLWIIPILQKVGRLDRIDAAAIAAHYGSVSVVTFLAGLAFMESINEPTEGFLPAMVAIMEFPGIIVALLLVQRASAGSGDRQWTSALRTVLTGKSVFLLLGGLFIGIFSGDAGLAKVSAFFVDPFQGVLCLFLLEMGMVAARRFADIRKVGVFLIAFGLMIPVLHALLGLAVGYWCGLSRGGATILAILAASASYIAAPATVRLALPQANPGLYLTSSLAITFPFNLTVGIPLYFALSGLFYL